MKCFCCDEHTTEYVIDNVGMSSEVDVPCCAYRFAIEAMGIGLLSASYYAGQVESEKNEWARLPRMKEIEVCF